MKRRYPHLTRQKTGASGAGQRWSLESLVDGMRYFIDVYHHFPSLHEADTFDYLPSQRTIRRSFGTMSVLKSLCEAFETTDEQREAIYHLLVNVATTMRVHERFVLRPDRVTCDFLIFHEDGTPQTVVDLLHVEDADELRKALAVKRRLYRDVTVPVVLVVSRNSGLSAEAVAAFVAGYQRQSRFHVVHETMFAETAGEMLSR